MLRAGHSIETIASERQRLWNRLSHGHGDDSTAERVVVLTRWLNGHAFDIRPMEPSRYMRDSGMYAERRRRLVEAS